MRWGARRDGSSLQTSHTQKNWATSLLVSPAAIVASPFLARLAFILGFHFYRFSATPSNFWFGFEMGGVARSLATGQGFSSPCGFTSGATALVPPVFPTLLALVFQVFGVYSDASGLVILTLNAVISALTCLVILWIGRQTFGETTGVVAAWVWAFWPMGFWEVRRVWDTCLSAFLFSLVFLSMLRLRSAKKSFALKSGLLWGVTALTNPSILGFLLPAAGWEWMKDGQRIPKLRRHLALAAGVAVLSIAPWVIRDYSVFHRWMIIRDNFGFEVYLGNHPIKPGETRFAAHFCNSASEANSYRSLGEIVYVDQKKKEAFHYISENPIPFIKRVLGRAFDLWAGSRETWLDVNVGASSKQALASWVGVWKHLLFGITSALAFWGLFLAFRRKMPHADLFFIIMLFPLLPYYLSHAENRFRHPIEPMLLLLASFPIVTLWQNYRARMRERAELPPVGLRN